MRGAVPRTKEGDGGGARGGQSGEKRLDDLYERLEHARGLPPEEAVRICKSIVNDSIRDEGEDPGGADGPRSEHWRRR